MSFLVPFFLSTGLMAIVYRWATRTFPALARRRRAVAITLAALVVGPVIMRFVVFNLHFGRPFETALVVVLMTLCFAALPTGVLHLLVALGSVIFRKRVAATPAPAEGAMTRRQVVEAVGGVAFIGATGSMLGWGSVRGRHAFEVVDLPVRIAGLPRTLDGYTIAQISDIHTGTYVGERELDEGLDRLRSARPDLVVVTGDLVDFDPAYTPLIARKLGALSPRDGVFACLGNHDYYAGSDTVLDTLRAAGVIMLVNEGRIIRAGDRGGFALLGADDRWAPRYGREGARLDRALETVPASAPRILLSHQPETVDRWPGKVALQLSGHTHGGQINPGFRPADLILRYVAGLYQVGGTALYVNRGFGTVGPPSRVGAPPEVTRVVLVAA